MNLHYQTGTATFIQLAIVMFLIVMNNIITFIATCTSETSECAITAMFSLIFIIMAGVWFLAVSAVGYAAQDKRSSKLSYALIAAELLTLAAAYGFSQYPSNWFGSLSAVVIMLSCAWIILLAWRLSRAKGGRIVTGAARRARHSVRNQTHPK